MFKREVVWYPHHAVHITVLTGGNTCSLIVLIRHNGNLGAMARILVKQDGWLDEWMDGRFFHPHFFSFPPKRFRHSVIVVKTIP